MVLRTPVVRTSVASGSRISRAERDRRNAAVIADRAVGFSWHEVSRRNHLSARQCQNIWNHRREHDPLPWNQRYELFHDHLTFMESTLGRLATLANETANDSVRLGAIKAGFEVRVRQLELQTSAGMLPADMSSLEAHKIFRELLDGVFQFLRDTGFYDKSDPATAERRVALNEFIETRLDELEQ